MSTVTHKVKGMTCEHCVKAVSNEISKLDGVTEVKVDLDSGDVTITSDSPLGDDSIRAAVDEAGYELVG